VSGTPEAWLRRQANDRPNASALVFDGHDLCFAALDQAVDRLAATLSAAVPASGRVLAGITEQTPLLALLSLAVPRAGAAFLPLNPKLPAAQISGLLAKAGAAAVISDRPDQTGPVLLRLDAALLSGAALTAVPSFPSPLFPRAVESSIHLIVATSGSTGEPKGTMLTGANLAAAVTASRQRLPIDPGDVWLGCLPLFHIGGLSVLFRCLEAGATMLLHSRFEAAAVTGDLAEGRASHISVVPAMLAQLMDQEYKPHGRLRHVLVGGAGLPAALADRALRAGWPIRPSYGMSEAGSQVATCADATSWRPGLAGRPLPGLVVGTAADGRIRIRGRQVMAGYLNPDLRPGEGIDADGWFTSNDIGGLLDDGCLRVLGRADDMLISGGENIPPAIVEDLASHCPGVEAIGVTGRTDPVWGDLIVAVVAGSISEQDFLAWCHQRLPSHQRPRRMIRVDALPLTVGGKLDRTALKRLAAAE
jgi:O-succinylbenzoic acid--CoA ligase